uniref:Uncharacterized protein n=1 Tax=Arundo donax TaxID=35708 RepID=A0A0A8ZRQ9_ARUDO
MTVSNFFLFALTKTKLEQSNMYGQLISFLFTPDCA